MTEPLQLSSLPPKAQPSGQYVFHEEIDSTSPFREPSANTQLQDESVTKSRPPTHKWLSQWMLEILAAIFSIALVAANIAILISIDGKPYEHWTVLNPDITPNALIFIISTISKASLLLPVDGGLGQLKWMYFSERARYMIDLQTFDDASRGPLGALKLLWSIKVRASMASAGAMLTVLALAADPFTQQVLEYKTVPWNATNVTASIGRTRAFDSGFRPPIAGEPPDPFKDLTGKLSASLGLPKAAR